MSSTAAESCKKALFTDSLKVNLSDSTTQCTGVLLPTTCTYSSASSVVAPVLCVGMRSSSPALLKSLQGTDHCTIKSAATHTVLFWTDSGFTTFASSSLFFNFWRGTSRGLAKFLARQLQQHKWRTHPEMSRHPPQLQHSAPFWLT